jgi:flagellar assembly protein FliH
VNGSATRITSAEYASSAQPWRAPDIEGTAFGSRHRRDIFGDTPEQADAAFERLRAEAYELGMASAKIELDRSRRALESEATAFAAALHSLAQPMALIDEQMQQQIAELSLSIARHLLRRELRQDPDQVIAIVRETLALLPATTPDIRVLLHPEDASLVRARLAQPVGVGAWTIIEDPTLARGGCRVTAGLSQIDARVETRLAAVVTAVLGEDRARERLSEESGAT